MRPSFDLSFERRAENLSRERRCQAEPIDTREARVILLRRFIRRGLAWQCGRH
jgi:hypothetical protein